MSQLTLNGVPAAQAFGRLRGRGGLVTTDRKLPDDRVIRLRLLAWSAVGVGCLFAAHGLAPQQGSLFAGPSGPTWWTAVICGITGVWLVPGVWLSAVLMRFGAGPAAWLGSRIATTLAWYALAGPLIHHLGQGARVTTGGILAMTTAATAAASLGVALGLSRRPAGHMQRILVAGVVGAVCAQVAITAARLMSADEKPYTHSVALDVWIVLGCALLVAVGAVSTPRLPPMMTAQTIRTPLIAIAAIAVAAAALFTISAKWSPAQQMPSAFSAEQVAPPPGADIAFALTAIGPDGAERIRKARFTAVDDAGRPLSVVAQSEPADGAAGDAMLLVSLDRRDQPTLCGDGRLDRAIQAGIPLKFTVREQDSGLITQAVIPVGWCDQ